MISANDPKLTSWIPVDKDSDFPIQNLPFGIFKTIDAPQPRVGVAIGNKIVDTKALHVLGHIQNQPFQIGDLETDCLNNLMKYGKKAITDFRNRISELLRHDNPELRDHNHIDQVIIDMKDAEMLLPVSIGDYTDFYSSIEHATNVGMMFRDPANALLPNWKHIPVGYHGRSSSIINTNVPIVRPKGQTKAPDAEVPSFGPTKLLDFELETAFFTYQGKPLGESISIEEAEDYIFGMVLLNDWSARDIQSWEYVPLGPFLAKNFASSISSWVVTMDALEPFRTAGPEQNPPVLPYLQFKGNKNIDINLEVIIETENGDENVICQSNYKYMYWNMAQQLAHHSVNGCNIRCGDMMGSGTISGKEPSAFGSMLELTWKGTKPLKMKDGSERKFINDNDSVIMRGYCKNENIRIGFGEVKTKVLPAN